MEDTTKRVDDLTSLNDNNPSDTNYDEDYSDYTGIDGHGTTDPLDNDCDPDAIDGDGMLDSIIDQLLNIKLSKGRIITRNEIIDTITDDFVSHITDNDIRSPEELANELTVRMQIAVAKANILIDINNNNNSSKNNNTNTGSTGQNLDTMIKIPKFKIPDSLFFDQIAALMLRLYKIARISCAGESADTDYDLLALYMEDGPDEGTYVTSEEEFYNLATKFNRRLTSKDFNEILRRLRAESPRKTRCMDKDLIAVNNGIFDFEKKELLPFTPDLVFMAKSHVDYNPYAKNIVIHNDQDGTDWDVESWMKELSDDPDIVDLLWQILSAIIRPHVRWNKSAWFYSESGNNGKGTLCELMRQLCGESAYASIPISDFGKDFALEPLTRSTAIIVDENDVGMFVDKAANLKAVITNDVIAINRKYKTPISYQFYGFMVQCLNEFPRIKDKSNSFYRRQLFVPFTKCFTGHERKYIKNDYLHRPEILEYVLYRVLHMNFYELSEPASCKATLAEYMEYNDPTRQFFEELEDQFTWNLLPFPFLYEMYKAWFRKNSPTGSIQGRNKFISEIVQVANAGGKWYCSDKSRAIRVGDKMQGPEPLIAEYEIKDWYNKNYVGHDVDKICTPVPQEYYRGLLRHSNGSSPDIMTLPEKGGSDDNTD